MAFPKEDLATLTTFESGTLLDDRLRLLRPLTVRIEKENEFFIAGCEYLEEFGYNHDPMSALDDLRVTIAELYWSLKEQQGRLGADLAQIWVRMKEVIAER